jgi:hypothetical protein
MGTKVKKAADRHKAGNFHLPSPDEIEAAMTPAGSWTAMQLAEWGVTWPPKNGWRRDLERRWKLENVPGWPFDAESYPSAAERSRILSLLAKHGGRFHGPIVETLSMPEDAFWRFMHEVQS